MGAISGPLKIIMSESDYAMMIKEQKAFGRREMLPPYAYTELCPDENYRRGPKWGLCDDNRHHD